jgi:hypothetical protein
MHKILHGTPLRALPLVLVLTIALSVIGCGHSSSDASDGPSDLSPADHEAQNAALAEIQRHWAKGPDGWTTSVVNGSAYAPDHFLRQCRALDVQELKTQDLTESDKLNGFEWVGRVIFKPTSCREGGGQAGMVLDGMSTVVVNKQSGRWSQWVDFTTGPLRLQKERGRWQFQFDGSYLRGTLPGPQDFANAGVK